MKCISKMNKTNEVTVQQSYSNDYFTFLQLESVEF